MAMPNDPSFTLRQWVLVYTTCGLLGLVLSYPVALASLKRPADCVALQEHFPAPFGWPLCPWSGK